MNKNKRIETEESMLSLKKVVILFNEDSSHDFVLEQFISGLVKNKFAKRKEVIEVMRDLFLIKK